MGWENFIYFAFPAVLLWLLSGGIIYNKRFERLSQVFYVMGIAIFASFIVLFWNDIQRPPFKTMGETRLWYSLFLTTIGFITYKHWKYKWLIIYNGIIATVFVVMNLVRPEMHTQNLMPALQSIWFIPHVGVYILSYSMFGAATVSSLIILNNLSKNKIDKKLLALVDNLVYSGFGFLTLGMLMGAIWAKEAWGSYWSWDPKETWAFLTSMAYLIYIHLRLVHKNKINSIMYWILVFSFILLGITWLGVSYLPSAQGSVHVY